jgi:hypothetical protein
MTEPTFGLSAEELQALGLLIVTCAILENQIDDVLVSFRATTTAAGELTQGVTAEPLSAKIQEMRTFARSDPDPEFVPLVKELRWAMAHVQKARNMLAHGQVLRDSEGRVSFWSQWKLKEMSIPDMIAVRPKALYAGKVTQQIRFRLTKRAIGGIWPMTPPPTLPDRPA